MMVLGRGKFAIDCIRTLQRLASNCPLLVLAEIETGNCGLTLAQFCEQNEIECSQYKRVNSDKNIELARLFAPDLCLSLNNFQIINAQLLSIARQGAINFHNGPLPEYAGLNVCSHAIIGGANQYGGTWHFMDESIDTGDIIARRMFPIAEDATALTLTIQCAKVGLELFKELVPVLATGEIPRQPMDKAAISYFGRNDLPFDGDIDFRWPFAQLDRFVRGLNFHPLPNPFIYPRAIYCDKSLYISQVKELNRVDARGAPGSILKIDENSISVMLQDGAAQLFDFLDANFEPISISDCVNKYNIRVGNRFMMPSDTTNSRKGPS